MPQSGAVASVTVSAANSACASRAAASALSAPPPTNAGLVQRVDAVEQPDARVLRREVAARASMSAPISGRASSPRRIERDRHALEPALSASASANFGSSSSAWSTCASPSCDELLRACVLVRVAHQQRRRRASRTARPSSGAARLRLGGRQRGERGARAASTPSALPVLTAAWSDALGGDDLRGRSAACARGRSEQRRRCSTAPSRNQESTGSVMEELLSGWGEGKGDRDARAAPGGVLERERMSNRGRAQALARREQAARAPSAGRSRSRRRGRAAVDASMPGPSSSTLEHERRRRRGARRGGPCRPRRAGRPRGARRSRPAAGAAGSAPATRSSPGLDRRSTTRRRSPKRVRSIAR